MMGFANDVDDALVEAEHLYGAAAVKLAVSRVRSVEAAFNSAEQRRAFPKGAALAEALRYRSWDAPEVFTEAQFEEFRALAEQSSIEDGLRALWFISENILGLTTVRPAYAPSDKTHEMVIRLI